jgi:hypothetical protein
MDMSQALAAATTAAAAAWNLVCCCADVPNHQLPSCW